MKAESPTADSWKLTTEKLTNPKMRTLSLFLAVYI
jgi:hypothetical protein